MIRDTFFSAPRFVNLMPLRSAMTFYESLPQGNGGELEGKFAPLRNDVRYNGNCFRMERIFSVQLSSRND